MMGELSASLGHEINQPIAAAAINARAGLRWLQREPPEIAEARRTVSRIVNDLDRVGGINYLPDMRPIVRMSSIDHHL